MVRCLYLFLAVVLFSGHAKAVLVEAWGDSLTAGPGGISWPAQFQSLSGATTLNYGIGGETSTKVRDRMLADTVDADFTVIWCGRNNFTDPSTVLADIAAMVTSLDSDKYIVLGVTNGDYGYWEKLGGTGYNQIKTLNDGLAAAFGSHYLDVRAVLVSHYNPALPQDVLDFGSDLVPTSLRSDNLHLNTAGYGVVAAAVYDRYLVSIPEPSSPILLATAGLLAFAIMRRRSFIRCGSRKG